MRFKPWVKCVQLAQPHPSARLIIREICFCHEDCDPPGVQDGDDERGDAFVAREAVVLLDEDTRQHRVSRGQVIAHPLHVRRQRLALGFRRLVPFREIRFPTPRTEHPPRTVPVLLERGWGSLGGSRGGVDEHDAGHAGHIGRGWGVVRAVSMVVLLRVHDHHGGEGDRGDGGDELGSGGCEGEGGGLGGGGDGLGGGGDGLGLGSGLGGGLVLRGGLDRKSYNLNLNVLNVCTRTHFCIMFVVVVVGGVLLRIDR